MNSGALVETRPDIAVEQAGSVARYIEASLSSATRRAYTSALKDFRGWCDEQGVSFLPASPEAVATYVAWLADLGRSVSTIEQRIAAIRWAHEAAEFSSPTSAKGVRATVQGIRRRVGVRPRGKAPATVERLTAMAVLADPTTLRGARDRALLLLGFASALRRSELVALRVEDLEETEQGLLVSVRRSKTDQEGKGALRAVPRAANRELCPVLSIRAWLEAAGIEEGHVFRSINRHERVGPRLSGRAVAEIVKQYARRAGLDPDLFAAHSLRAGFVTSAAERGRSSERIMDHTGHRSIAMVRVYTRRVDVFRDNAGAGML